MTIVSCVILLFMVVVAPYSEAAVSCTQVQRSLKPCFNYLLRGGATSSQCCTGVRTLYASAGTTADRQTVCNCLKRTAKIIKRIKLSNATVLPRKCGVSIPYKISPSTDCSKLK
ncbi:unnamed protein product [Fraxinus pennsylvanica]|uniref:Non-specific lipid-transfer protein n=1 Tax=Fraxinus pennsylvanica TaxID=56036 RepID=A0AAD1Z618_9LAMI|nr:unnamed protein product [Fraxinus pennsylvanica]